MNEPNASTDQDPLAHFSAEDLIHQFGGIRPMAAKLGVPVTTVQGWKSRGRIPINRRQAILEAARINNVDLSVDAERQPPEKPVTITSVPVSVKIEPGGAEKEADTVAETPAAKEAPKADEPSGQPNKAWSEKSRAVPPKSSGGSKLLLFALVGGLLLGGVYYFQPGLLGLGSASGDVKNGKDGGSPATSEVPPVDSAKPTKEDPAKTPPVQPVVQSIGEPAAQIKPADEKVKKPEKKQPGSSGESALDAGKAAEEARQVAAKVAQDTAEETAKRLIAERTKSLAQQLAVLAKKTGKLGETDRALADTMKSELAQFHEQMASIREDLKQLSGKLASLKTTPTVSGEKIALHALLLGQLEAEVTGGRPYRASLDRLEKAVADTDIKNLLKGLEPHAGKGVPTRLVLTKRFQTLSRKLSLAPAEPVGAGEAGTGFGAWMMTQLRSLVSVRRVSGPGRVPPLSKAEAAVADGDFERAVGHLERVASPAAAPWITDARAYVNSREIIGKLRWQVSALLRKTNTSK